MQLAYKFGELVEVHAADTYAEFVDANEVCLQPPADTELHVTTALWPIWSQVAI